MEVSRRSGDRASHARWQEALPEDGPRNNSRRVQASQEWPLIYAEAVHIHGNRMSDVAEFARIQTIRRFSARSLNYGNEITVS